MRRVLTLLARWRSMEISQTEWASAPIPRWYCCGGYAEWNIPVDLVGLEAAEVSAELARRSGLNDDELVGLERQGTPAVSQRFGQQEKPGEYARFRSLRDFLALVTAGRNRSGASPHS